MKSNRSLLLLLLFVCLAQPKAHAQGNTSLGKGINFMAADSSLSVKMSARFQTLLIAEKTLNDPSAELATELLVRRARLKFDGFAFHPSLTYKIELGLSNRDQGRPITETGNAPGIIYDAVVKWNLAKGLSLWFGQTKLPGNRERVISSQQLQLVDRSIVNSEFNIDRDLGFQVHHEFKAGRMVVREIAAISQGEGRNITVANHGGYDYTARVEILPFGNFKNKGDYFGADLEREEKPKLSLAAGYDFNDRATRRQGQLGNFVTGEKDLKTVMADLMFKYKGFSVMAEYMDKKADNPLITDSAGKIINSFVTGSGITAQAGYLFKNNWEVAGRYSMVTPSETLNNPDVTQYTLGISKYVKGHSLKMQSDISLTETEGSDTPELMYRFQVEVAF